MPQLLIVFPTTAVHKAIFKSIAPDWEIIYAGKGEITETLVSQSEAIIGNIPVGWLRHAAKLRWLQLLSSGADAYTVAGILPTGVVLTNSTGAYGPAVSENLLALTLSLMKNIPLYRDAQNRAEWVDQLPIRTILGSTVLVVGLGDVGGQFAKRIHALGAYVIGIRRLDTDKPDYVDELYLSDGLDTVLPRADIVVLTLPGGKMTHHLFDAQRIARMKKGALLLNAGRGSVIDTEALCQAVSEGHLGGAGLDVFETEPLPVDHLLWRMPQVMITPHVAGRYAVPATYEAVVAICQENLARFVSGQTLKNIVDRSTGYKAKQYD